MFNEKRGGLHICIEAAGTIKKMVNNSITAFGYVLPGIARLARDHARNDVRQHSGIDCGLPGPAVKPKQ